MPKMPSRPSAKFRNERITRLSWPNRQAAALERSPERSGRFSQALGNMAAEMGIRKEIDGREAESLPERFLESGGDSCSSLLTRRFM